MTNITTTTEATTTEALTEALTKATTTEARAAIVADGLAIIEQAEAGTGVLTFKVWQAMGQAAISEAMAQRDNDSKAKVTQGEAWQALAGKVIGLPTKQAVGRWIRAARVTRETFVECQDADGQADGPVSLSKAVNILTWCEAKAETAGTTNRGTATATKAEAEAKQAEQAKQAEATEQAKAERRAKQSKARGNVVQGLLTVKAIREATEDQLKATIVACQDQIALRHAEAEAKAKAEREQAKATKDATKATEAEAKAERDRIIAEAKAEAEAMIAAAKAKVAEAKAAS